MGEEQPEAVEADDDGAAFVGKDSEGEGEASAQCKDEHEDDGAEGDDEVLADDTPSLAAEADGVVEAFDPVVHEDHFALFEGGIAAASAHRDRDIGGGEAGSIIDAVPDHGDAMAFFPELLHEGDFVLREEAGVDVCFFERKLSGDIEGRFGAVAGEHDGPDSGDFEVG